MISYFWVIYPNILFNILNVLVKCTSSYTQNAVGPTICSLRKMWLWKYLLPLQNIGWTLNMKLKLTPFILKCSWSSSIYVNPKEFFDNFLYQNNVPPCILISMIILLYLKTIKVVTWVENSSWLLKWEEKSKTMSLTLRGFCVFLLVLLEWISHCLSFFFHPSLNLAWHIHFACF